jgi:hypothetical protein
MRKLMKSFRVHFGGFTPVLAPFWVIASQNVRFKLLDLSVCVEVRKSYPLINS